MQFFFAYNTLKTKQKKAKIHTIVRNTDRATKRRDQCLRLDYYGFGNENFFLKIYNIRGTIYF